MWGGLPEVSVFTGSQGLGVRRGAGLLGAANPYEDAAQTPVLGCSLGGLLKPLLSGDAAWVSFYFLCTLILRECELWGGLLQQKPIQVRACFILNKLSVVRVTTPCTS